MTHLGKILHERTDLRAVIEIGCELILDQQSGSCAIISFSTSFRQLLVSQFGFSRLYNLPRAYSSLDLSLYPAAKSNNTDENISKSFSLRKLQKSCHVNVSIITCSFLGTCACLMSKNDMRASVAKRCQSEKRSQSHSPDIEKLPEDVNYDNDIPGDHNCPDGGFDAWMVVVADFWCCFNTWGFTNFFGVFETYYLENELSSYSSSTVAWIGSVQTFFIFMPSFLVGRWTDAGYVRPMMIFGTLVQVFGLIMTSISKV